MRESGNLFEDLPDASGAEVLETLLARSGLRIERIVSHGQSTPAGEWYDQTSDEWVVVLQGAARLRIEDEPEHRELGPGDFLFLPAHCRHRVERTDPGTPTVWLTIHMASEIDAG
ncbi:MAG: cupin domain-containing protein [Alphaproteobacteria bacterium]|nr:cupin domain-containing protein [Alphaproteobacteria bacterium]